MQDFPWAIIIWFMGLIGGGIGILVKMGKFETKTDIRLNNVEGKVDGLVADVKGIMVTLARMEGQAMGRAEKNAGSHV